MKLIAVSEKKKNQSGLKMNSLCGKAGGCITIGGAQKAASTIGFTFGRDSGCINNGRHALNSTRLESITVGTLGRAGGCIFRRNTRHCPDDVAKDSNIADKTAQIHNS